MKRFLLSTFLLCACVTFADEVASTNVVEVHWTEAYKVNGTINLFLHGPADILDDMVPPSAKWAKKNVVYDEDGNELSYELKTVRELAPHYWTLDDGSVILLCAAMEVPTLRNSKFSIDDAEMWKYFKEMVWPDVGDFITNAERLSLMQTDGEESDGPQVRE